MSPRLPLPRKVGGLTPQLLWERRPCTRPLQFPSPFPSLALYTSLSLRWALTRLQASGLAESTARKERGRAASTCTLHTPSGTPDGVALHYICSTPEAVHWASPRGMPQHWYVKRHVPPRKRKIESAISLAEDGQQKIGCLLKVVTSVVSDSMHSGNATQLNSTGNRN